VWILTHPGVDRGAGGITSNPAVHLFRNGSILLVYKSVPVGYPERNSRSVDFSLGAAIADDFAGPYRRSLSEPLLAVNGTPLAAEDPYIWRCGDGVWHLVFKYMGAPWRISTGLLYTGLLAYSKSPDLRNWTCASAGTELGGHCWGVAKRQAHQRCASSSSPRPIQTHPDP
jgi:hypothetical protein